VVFGVVCWLRQNAVPLVKIDFCYTWSHFGPEEPIYIIIFHFRVLDRFCLGVRQIVSGNPTDPGFLLLPYICLPPSKYEIDAGL
jgi:hypothetical protein